MGVKMPCDYKDYPENWKTEIRPDILERANNCCEFCGVENYAITARQRGEKWAMVKIILTIAHLNHNVKDNRHENLKALCQRCHLRYDAKYHAENRHKNKAKKSGQYLLIFTLLIIISGCAGSAKNAHTDIPPETVEQYRISADGSVIRRIE